MGYAQIPPETLIINFNATVLRDGVQRMVR
jgi:hypothetical protein